MDNNKLKRIGTYVAIAVYYFLFQFYDIAENRALVVIGFILVLSAGIGWITKKIVTKEFLPLVAPFSLQLSILIVVLASAVLIGEIGLAMIDTVALGVGLLWLLMKPGIGPIALLTLFHAGTIGMQAYVLAIGAPVIGGPVNLALFIVLRAFAIYYLVIGLREYKKNLADKAILISLEESAEEIA